MASNAAGMPCNYDFKLQNLQSFLVYIVMIPKFVISKTSNE